VTRGRDGADAGKDLGAVLEGAQLGAEEPDLLPRGRHVGIAVRVSGTGPERHLRGVGVPGGRRERQRARPGRAPGVVLVQVGEPGTGGAPGQYAGRAVHNAGMTVDDELSALMTRFFQAVSFPAGGTPAYDQIHDLFTPTGRLINAIGDIPDDTTVAGFIEPRQTLVDTGTLTSFEEQETSAITESFRKVAHRFSNYEKRGTRDGKPFEARGTITTQFIHTQAGWKITSMAWDDEP
jgi:hypothetical protein